MKCFAGVASLFDELELEEGMLNCSASSGVTSSSPSPSGLEVPVISASNASTGGISCALSNNSVPYSSQ